MIFYIKKDYKRIFTFLTAFTFIISILSSCGIKDGQKNTQGSNQEWKVVESQSSWKVKDSISMPEDTSFSRLALTYDACYELNTETGILYEYQLGSGIYQALSLDSDVCAANVHYLYFGVCNNSLLEIVTVSDDGIILNECDTSGKLLKRVVIPDALVTNNNISQVITDEQSWYLLSDGVACRVDVNGLGEVISDQEIRWIVQLSDGVIFLADEIGETDVYRLNDSQELILWETVPLVCSLAIAGEQQENIVFLNSKISSVELSGKTLTNEAELISAGITENEVKQFALDEDSIRLLRMMDDGCYQIVTLEESDEEDTRQVVKLLTDSTGLQNLEDKVIKFNEENEDYRIEIINLSDDDSDTSFFSPEDEDSMRKLQLLMESDDVPDIVDVSVFYDWRDYALKGYFETLDAYIEDSDVISPENYLENIYAAGMESGETYFVPYSFMATLYWGKTEYVGEDTGWTLAEALNCSDAFSEINIFNYEQKSDCLNALLTMSLSEFVDTDTQSCNFETDLFYRSLEKCNAVEYISYEGDWADWTVWDDLVNDKALLEDILVSCPEDILAFNTEREVEREKYMLFHMKGYPSAEESCYSVAHLPSGSCFVIPTKAEQKDGAWEFIEAYHSEYDAGFNYLALAIPAREEWLETRMDNTMSITTNGLEIKEGYVLTEEERELFREVARSARVLTTSEEQILDIICEEADAYFEGDKSVEDVAAIIQSRIGMFLKEGN